MTTPLIAILEMDWEDQEEHLRKLSKVELEVLWFQIQVHAEYLDRLHNAAYSMLRKVYEGMVKEVA